MTALTEWYPPEVKPVRVGHYETVINGLSFDIPICRFWNGKNWTFTDRTYLLVNQERHWRGLAADPKGTK